MRGITPVIAIILLLLMAVAAAGGFYFVYQGFTESGEESGSTQIESLGEQSLAAIQIESAAGGRIYVRNVGASDIDLSKSTVYVEDRPVEVNRSADTLAERNRAVLKLTEAPGCTQEKCEVKISGAASTSKTVDLAKLLCSSNADCYSGESCEDGICVEGEEEAAVCGDGECSGDEDGESCFEDCCPRKMALYSINLEPDVYSFDWNGSAYVKGENVTATEHNNIIYRSRYDSQGNILGIGVAGQPSTTNTEVHWVYYDGSWTFDNVTSNDWQETLGIHGWDFNSSDEAIAVWTTQPGDITWASFDGASWSEPQNITNNEGTGMNIWGPGPDFSFLPNDKGVVIWTPSQNGWNWVNYSVWDGGWVESGHILELDDSYDHSLDYGVTKANSTHVMAAWALEYDYLPPPYNTIIQWATWDGSEWSDIQNVSDEPGGMMSFDIESDESGDWLLVVVNTTSNTNWREWFSWQDGWVFEGNITDDTGFGYGFMDKNENGALWSISTVQSSSLFEELMYWDGTSWQGPVAVYN